MITVRFPSGFSVQYNSLAAQKWSSDGRQLLFETAEARDAGHGWKVAVPAECIVEFIAPCRTYNPAAADPAKIEQIVASLELLAKDLRSLKREVAKWKAAR